MTQMARILIIDDEPGKQEALGKDICEWGHMVVTADTAQIGFSKAKHKTPDLILLDLKMPGMDGIDCLKLLKADAETRDIPVIIVSATADASKHLSEAIEHGADDLLTVPFGDKAVLKARINNGLQKSQQISSLKDLTNELARTIGDLDEKKARIDELLLSLFPERFAEELKESDAVKPRGFENVAVLFADIAGFTGYCDRHRSDPERVVRMLETYIERCEVLCEQNSVEKIKAIGDGFMAAAGLMKEDQTARENATNAVICGELMTRAAAEILPDGLQVRVGVHIGFVMGGKIGRKKYCFDIWGDTVNTAARVESNGVPGSVVASPNVWNLVSDRVRGSSLGMVDLKGRQSMELWRIDAIL